MTEGSKPAALAGENEIVATRIFDAPRELVFKLWTDRGRIGNWWGPKGFSLTIHEMDVRQGGTWKFIMHGPDGRDYPNENVYVEIVEPERIVYDHVSPPRHRMAATFADLGGAKTRLDICMTFESAGFREAVVREYGAVEGLDQTLGRLEEQVAFLAGASA